MISTEQILKSYWAYIKPVQVDEIDAEVQLRRITESALRAAILRYRKESTRGQYPPSLRDLSPYLHTETLSFRPISKHTLITFWSMVEYYGWEFTIRRAYETGIGLDPKQNTQMREHLRANNIAPDSIPFQEHILLDDNQQWYGEYLRILHVELDPHKALQYGADNAPERKRGYFHRKVHWLKDVPAEVLIKNWPCLRGRL